MRSRFRGRGLAAAFLLAVAGTPLAAAPAPRLVVMVSVDGLSWPRLEAYRPWFVAGLKRLLDQGWVETSCHYRHLNTETGPGHASLSTGAPPRITGIVANQWFEQKPDGSLREVYCASQPDGGGAPGTILGPGNMRVATLGDRLVSARSGSRVVSLAVKDRSAIFLAGHDPRHVVYWFDEKSGQFTSSAAYDVSQGPGAAARSLVARFNAERAGAALRARFGARWARLPLAPGLRPPSPPPLWAPKARAFNPYPTPALLDFQIPANGLGFDHDLLTPGSSYFASLYVSPFVDELLADLSLAFIEDPAFALGGGNTPDLLALSFPAQDVVSHSYGQESEENLDVLRRLDVQIGRLFEAFDRRFSPGELVLALSADHGFCPIPESEKRFDESLAVGRLVTGTRGAVSFVDRLNRLMGEALCLPPRSKVIHGIESWSLFYERPAVPLRTAEGSCGPAGARVGPAEIDAALPRVVGQFFREELEEVLLVSQRSEWPRSDPAVEFAVNDFDPERSGDAFLVPRPYVLLHWDPARGSGHGSHHDYDTNVPLVFWGGPFRAGASSSETTPYDLAPTLAQLLGITLPNAVGASRAPR